MGVERYRPTSAAIKLAQRLVYEYDKHEAIETKREADTCRACPYCTTCRYSIYKYKNRLKNLKQRG